MAKDRHEWFLTQVFRYRAALNRYVRRLTSQSEDLEDIVQETYVRMYSLAETGSIDSPKAMLFRVAHNLVMERARRQKIRATDSVADLEPLGVLSVEMPLDEQVYAHHRFESFCTAVGRLPPICRRVFILRKVYKLSHAEIAEMLNMSENTIDKHVSKGLVRCRDSLRDQGLLDVGEKSAAADSSHRFKKSGENE
jgi:RNA polymerase sigma factor (sigma-70 family)